MLVSVTHPSFKEDEGQVLTLGEGDTGQLGLGPEVLERMKPSKVNIDPVKQVAAGGMHTACLKADGSVSTCQQIGVKIIRHLYSTHSFPHLEKNEA